MGARKLLCSPILNVVLRKLTRTGVNFLLAIRNEEPIADIVPGLVLQSQILASKKTSISTVISVGTSNNDYVPPIFLSPVLRYRGGRQRRSVVAMDKEAVRHQVVIVVVEEIMNGGHSRWMLGTSATEDPLLRNGRATSMPH